MNRMRTSVQNAFTEKFGRAPEYLVHAPGRINLIGEHTDYNHGYVLPAAVDAGLWFAFGQGGKTHHWYAMDADEQIEIPVDLTVSRKGWPEYFMGAAHILKGRTGAFTGTQCVFASDLPAGAGLSSSSALTCGFLLGMDAMFDLHYSRESLAWLAHLVEHDYIGLQGGIMDQHAILLSRKDHFLLLNCLDRSYVYVPFDSREQATLFLINTHVKHKLTETEYNTRATECREALDILKGPAGIETLHEITRIDLAAYREVLGPLLYRRVNFIREENLRVFSAVEALNHQDWPTLGTLLTESHAGLRDDYHVSCPELDFLVEHVAGNAHIHGGRMMGGGFGGCTVNLAGKLPSAEWFASLTAQYQRQFGRIPELIPVSPADGATVHSLL